MKINRMGWAISLLPIALTGCNRQDVQQNNSAFRHVVVIVSDDHASHTLGCYGNDLIRTPYLDRLAEEGISFTNAYCNAPICSASRQSMLTGQYPQSTGVTLLFTPFSETGNPTIADHLGRFGFTTALIGKTHFNHWIWYNLWDKWPSHGFDTIMENNVHREWLQSQQKRSLPANLTFYERPDPSTDPTGTWNTENRPHGVYDEQSQGTFFAREAIRFMKRNKDDRFLLWLAFNEPHAPFHYPVEYADSYSPDDLILPPGSPEDDRWVPALFRKLTEKQRKGIIAAYYTSVEYLDKNVGLVINALDELGIREQTLIIYISDNGYLLNEHKRFEKHTMWAESVKVPLIISGKNIPRNVKTDAIIEGVDLVPTICDLLNVPPVKEAQGKSYKKLLTGEAEQIKDYAFSVFLEDNMAMIAGREWKYIFMTGKRDLGLEYATGFGPAGITHFLYNQLNDPSETKNLASDTACSHILNAMQHELLTWFRNTHPYAGEIPAGLSSEGELVWFCEPRDVGSEYGGEPLRIIANQ